MDAQEKEAKLIEWLREKGRIAIAFSGGVDSTYLLRVAIDALGSDNVLPIHAQAQLHSRREEHEAEDYARDMGAHLVVLPMDMHARPVRQSARPLLYLQDGGVHRAVGLCAGARL